MEQVQFIIVYTYVCVFPAHRNADSAAAVHARNKHLSVVINDALNFAPLSERKYMSASFLFHSLTRSLARSVIHSPSIPQPPTHPRYLCTRRQLVQLLTHFRAARYIFPYDMWGAQCLLLCCVFSVFQTWFWMILAMRYRLKADRIHEKWAIIDQVCLCAVLFIAQAWLMISSLYSAPSLVLKVVH